MPRPILHPSKAHRGRIRGPPCFEELHAGRQSGGADAHKTVRCGHLAAQQAGEGETPAGSGADHCLRHAGKTISCWSSHTLHSSFSPCQSQASVTTPRIESVLRLRWNRLRLGLIQVDLHGQPSLLRGPCLLATQAHCLQSKRVQSTAVHDLEPLRREHHTCHPSRIEICHRVLFSSEIPELHLADSFLCPHFPIFVGDE
mmetsp:Transcript_37720/g.90581  ORF Transcript_37720/g.90581 Transcript_37720/m.90581 type:complete len:200 (-) Transcript_37720:378-977(-)